MDLESFLKTCEALLTPTVAVLAVVISYRQFRVERQATRIALFERRFEVYNRTLSYIQTVLYSNEPSSTAASEFWVALREAPFLFRQDVCEALNQVHKRGIAISVALDMIRQTPPENELGYRYEIQDARLWLGKSDEHLAKLFRNYIQVV